jgi:radical SAM superfamily enzyme YgiQ (UPF0313 family)
MNNSVDCLFVTVPFTDTRQPLIATGILRSIADKANKTSATLDFNAEFIHLLDSMPEEERFSTLAFFREGDHNGLDIEKIQDLFHNMAKKVIEMNPTYVGISVFTYNCRVAAKYLSWFIKKINPEIKIILGGTGIIKHMNGRATFAESLLKNKLIDVFIYGDGEQALYHYLSTGKTNYPGINKHLWTPMKSPELEALPAPVYDDYNFSLYEEPIMLPIIGSRGCVRKCTFCDVHTHWTKFGYRGGEHIFEEMKEHAEKYNIYQFHFGDSLVNGNLKEYRNMLKLIAEYNKNQPDDKKISWVGQCILRPKNQFTEEDWKLTAEGGGDVMIVGIETINDQVREQIGKKFTNEDIKFSFDMAKKYGKTRFTLLFLTGYPGETDADYDFLEQWVRDLAENYKDVIYGINTGVPLSVLENTPLQDNFDSMGMVSVGPAPEDWELPGTGNTPVKRVEWNDRFVKVVSECGFDIFTGHDAHHIIERVRRRNA